MVEKDTMVPVKREALPGDNDLFTLVRNARNFLVYHHLLGIKSYPAGPALLTFLHPTPNTRGVAVVAPRKTTGSARQFTPATSPDHDSPPRQTQPIGDLAAVQAELEGCTRCLLHEKRHTLIFGEGKERPRLMVIGDWPGTEDDCVGRPFQGSGGEMLTNMLKAIGLPREEVYITTLVKCLPPADRPPTRDEIATCLSFLFQQIAALAPSVICAMGPLATQTLLATDQPLTRLRGSFHNCHGVALMPTFHPRFLEKHPEMKKATWQDLLLIKKKLAK